MRCLLIVLALATAPAALAQEDPVAPGVRVRIRTSDVVEIPGLARIDGTRNRVEGLVIASERGTMTVRSGALEPVTLPHAKTTLVGRVVSMDDDTLTITLDGRPLQVTVPRTAVANMDVSRSRRPAGLSALRGAGIGVAVGGAAGALLGLVSGDDQCPASRQSSDWFGGGGGCWILFSAGEKAAMGGVFFGTLGGLVGAAIGATHAERWQRLPTRGSPKVTFSVRPVGKLGLSLAVGF